MTPRNHRKGYVLCVSNRGFRASLIVRKVYRTLSDPKAEARGFIRVIDESGEGYVYPENFFVAIEVPREASRAFRAAS
ncbi:MAG TPA: hypothetical protein VGK89_09395 [Candidatus Eisenbacteria bacterium]|jgi:hypothetical protein